MYWSKTLTIISNQSIRLQCIRRHTYRCTCFPCCCKLRDYDKERWRIRRCQLDTDYRFSYTNIEQKIRKKKVLYCNNKFQSSRQHTYTRTCSEDQRMWLHFHTERSRTRQYSLKKQLTFLTKSEKSRIEYEILWQLMPVNPGRQLQKYMFCCS